jgi:hypothetical protein
MVGAPFGRGHLDALLLREFSKYSIKLLLNREALRCLILPFASLFLYFLHLLNLSNLIPCPPLRFNLLFLTYPLKYLVQYTAGYYVHLYK